MGNTPTTSFRLAPELLGRLDRYAERLAAVAGIPVSRAAAAAKLLTAALDAEEEQTGKGRAQRPSSGASRRGRASETGAGAAVTAPAPKSALARKTRSTP